MCIRMILTKVILEVQDTLVSSSKGPQDRLFSYSSFLLGGIYFQDAEANIFGETDCKHCLFPSEYSGLGLGLSFGTCSLQKLCKHGG